MRFRIPLKMRLLFNTLSNDRIIPTLAINRLVVHSRDLTSIINVFVFAVRDCRFDPDRDSCSFFFSPRRGMEPVAQESILACLLWVRS